MPADALVDPLMPLLVGGTRPARGRRLLRRETVVAAPLDETFAFFADARNLERLTPPWLHFSIRTPPPLAMREGLEIDYRIVLRGVPMPWRSRIDVWEPCVRFVDRQLVGPYRWWRHEHRFEAAPGGTRVVDEVEFMARLSWASGRFVSRELERIFAFRQDALRQILGPAHEAVHSASAPLRRHVDPLC
jgi:ligand-binding SRPBCC domain-containing protein